MNGFWARAKFLTTARIRRRCLIALPGGGWFEIYAAEGAPENRGNNKLAGFRHVALRVDSIEAAKAELEKRGVKFNEEIRPAAGWPGHFVL